LLYWWWGAYAPSHTNVVEGDHMNLNEIYEEMKQENNAAIAFIKSGKFYLTYENDATIISYLFGYKKTKGKVGFPIESIKKVLKKLDESRINYAIYNGSAVLFDDNNYYKLFEEANKDIIVSGMTNDLTKKIKDLIKKDANNYQKIKDFIDEL